MKKCNECNGVHAQDPVCTVLMCTNKFDEYFVDAVNSCLEQSFTKFEMIIVVNGLSDHVYNKIKLLFSDKRVRLVNSVGSYLTYNLNIGLYFACTDYIMRMDADDVCMPNRLEVQYNYMKNHDDVIVCGCNYRSINEENNILDVVKYPETDVDIRKHLYFRNPFVHSGVMIRKSYVMDIGGYMGGKYAQDYDLWVRAVFESNYKFYNIQEVLLLYRSVGADARASKYSYAVVSSTQMRMFVYTLNPIWLLCSIVTFFKRIVKGD